MSSGSKTGLSVNPAQARSASVISAVGMNFADTYFRQGYYPVPLPKGWVSRASGVIEAVGPQRERVQARRSRHVHRQPARRLFDRACHADRLADQAAGRHRPSDGSCHDHARPERRLLAAEDQPWMKSGDTILLHAAAGGVGLIAVQWAKLLGLRVIGTVSTLEKAAIAKAHGCDEIIFYRRKTSSRGFAS